MAPQLPVPSWAQFRSCTSKASRSNDNTFHLNLNSLPLSAHTASPLIAMNSPCQLCEKYPLQMVSGEEKHNERDGEVVGKSKLD